VAREKIGENTVLWFAATDQKKYRVELSQQAIGQTIDVLQGTADRLTGGPVRTLTVLAHEPAATPDRKGILVRTQEWGTIALEMPPEALSVLLMGLAALVAPPESSSKH
jgi:hypothetical protein